MQLLGTSGKSKSRTVRDACSSALNLVGVLVCLAILSGAAAPKGAIVEVTSVRQLIGHGVQFEAAAHAGKRGFRLTPDPAVEVHDGGVFAEIADVSFENGVIEADISGEPHTGSSKTARGFVGFAFHVSSDRSHYEYIYIRPTNGRADDQVRRNHSTQYSSHPDYPWHRLRSESPAAYESYVDVVPGRWTHVRIEVNGNKARLYVDQAPQPTLIVNDLKLGTANGGIGLWIGPETVAHFANVRITRQ